LRLDTDELVLECVPGNAEVFEAIDNTLKLQFIDDPPSGIATVDRFIERSSGELTHRLVTSRSKGGWHCLEISGELCNLFGHPFAM